MKLCYYDQKEVCMFSVLLYITIYALIKVRYNLELKVA